jgi:CubicO group peptidase (beta-lactamase class C family)
MAATAAAGGSACLVVTKDGRLVDEHYWDGSDAATKREAFSVTKSITATLLGIAADRGFLDIDQPVADFVEEWKGTPSAAVTIRNLLAMDSGRRQDLRTDYLEMATRAEDKTAFSIGLDQQHEPGTVWVYNNAGVQVLEAVIEAATGQDMAAFAEAVLFEPIGMATDLNRDVAGNTLAFMGAQSSCRDLARFGLLHLRLGDWNGDQVISRAWVEEATAPSQDLNDGYGFLWWLDDQTYAARGLFEQLVIVFPESGVVVTRLGSDKGPTGATFGFDDVVRGVENAVGGSTGS